jgi:hypothetical protein
LLLSTDYGEKVTFLVAVKKPSADSFEKGIIDYLQGKVEISAGQEYYMPFKV